MAKIISGLSGRLVKHGESVLRAEIVDGEIVVSELGREEGESRLTDWPPNVQRLLRQVAQPIVRARLAP